MQPGKISVMIALFMMTSFLGQIFWGYICDRIKSDKKIFLLCGVISLALYFLIYSVPDNNVFMILYAVYGLFFFPMGSILDAWLLKLFHFDKKIYSMAKAYDSISFGIWIPVVGFLIPKIGFVALPVCSSILVIITLAIASRIKDSTEVYREGQTVHVRDAMLILKNPQMAILIILSLLQGLAFAPINSLKIMLIENLGGTVSYQGIDGFLACTVQFLFFLIVGKFGFIEIRKRMLLHTVIYFASVCVFSIVTNYMWIAAGSMLSSIGYTFLILATREYIEKQVDISLQTTINSLLDSVYRSLAGVIGLMYSGFVIEAAGVNTMTRISCVYIVLSLILLILFYSKMALPGTAAGKTAAAR
jgi:MFS family permease